MKGFGSFSTSPWNYFSSNTRGESSSRASLVSINAAYTRDVLKKVAVPRAGFTLAFMRILAALSVIFTLALSASPARAQRLPFEKSFDAAGFSTLAVSTMRGKIHIVPGDADRSVVGGAVTVRIGIDVPLNALELAQKIAANPPIERAGNTVRLRPPADARERRAVTVNYEVRVPANTTVVSVSDSGETTIAGIIGPVDVRTQSGAIALE